MERWCVKEGNMDVKNTRRGHWMWSSEMIYYVISGIHLEASVFASFSSCLISIMLITILCNCSFNGNRPEYRGNLWRKVLKDAITSNQAKTVWTSRGFNVLLSTYPKNQCTSLKDSLQILKDSLQILKDPIQISKNPIQISKNPIQFSKDLGSFQFMVLEQWFHSVQQNTIVLIFNFEQIRLEFFNAIYWV